MDSNSNYKSKLENDLKKYSDEETQLLAKLFELHKEKNKINLNIIEYQNEDFKKKVADSSYFIANKIESLELYIDQTKSLLLSLDEYTNSNEEEMDAIVNKLTAELKTQPVFDRDYARQQINIWNDETIEMDKTIANIEEEILQINRKKNVTEDFIGTKDMEKLLMESKESIEKLQNQLDEYNKTSEKFQNEENVRNNSILELINVHNNLFVEYQKTEREYNS